MSTATPLRYILNQSFEWCDEHGVHVPADLYDDARRVGVFGGKAAGDLAGINAAYHDEITSILTAFFEQAGRVTAYLSQFKRAVVQAFGDAFDLGWTDGGGELPPDADALAWFNARVETEFGFISQLLQQAKDLRGGQDFDSFSWTTARADAYTNSLRELYNAGKVRASADRMVTFDGNDGAESCPTCQKLKGQRHRISWFVKHNYVPPRGNGLECAPGGLCQHYLIDDQGQQVTV